MPKWWLAHIILSLFQIGLAPLTSMERCWFTTANNNSNLPVISPWPELHFQSSAARRSWKVYFYFPKGVSLLSVIFQAVNTPLYAETRPWHYPGGISGQKQSKIFWWPYFKMFSLWINLAFTSVFIFTRLGMIIARALLNGAMQYVVH